MIMSTKHVWWLVLLLSTVRVPAAENDWFVPLGPPPKAHKRNISSGESVAPLPGPPVVPMRVTERKRDPSPPNLIGKVIWGAEANYGGGGGKMRIADWNLCPGDVQELMKSASTRLGTTYGADSLTLASFDGDPAKTPVLFFSGVRGIKFSARDMELLRGYVLRGGMIVADSIAGSPYFYDSFRAAMEQMLPETQFRSIPIDHPIYHMILNTEKATYSKNVNLDRPALEGMYVYSRVGVVLSKYGLGCGWDGHEVPLLPQAQYYHPASAERIGINLIAYAIGYARLGREQAKPELFGALDEKRPSDEFVFAQIMHDGAWNAESGGATRLLAQLRQTTALRVSLKRVPVRPGKDDLSSYTFLYLAGLDDYHWDAAAVAALKRFLESGGTLLINNSLGLHTFDAAVRRELKKLLPENELTPVSSANPLFSSVFKITDAEYTPAARALRADLNTPRLEGIALHGDVKVIYSPYDLEAGWQGMEHPLALAYEPDSALKLGINIIMYAMTH